jgi:hypothetical protein
VARVCGPAGLHTGRAALVAAKEGKGMREMVCPSCGATSFDVVERNIGIMTWQVVRGRLVSPIGNESVLDCEGVFFNCAVCDHTWEIDGVSAAADLFPEIKEVA